MFLNKTRITLILSAAIFLIGTATNSQAQTLLSDSAPASRTIPVAVNDPCENPSSADVADLCRLLSKTLADLDAADVQIKSRDGQILNLQDTVKLQEQRFQKMLEILREFVGVEQKDKKSWWARTKKVLGDIIKTVTDPDTIRLILLAIAVIESRN